MSCSQEQYLYPWLRCRMRKLVWSERNFWRLWESTRLHGTRLGVPHEADKFTRRPSRSNRDRGTRCRADAQARLECHWASPILLWARNRLCQDILLENVEGIDSWVNIGWIERVEMAERLQIIICKFDSSVGHQFSGLPIDASDLSVESSKLCQ